MADVAERAAARALVAHDHEGGRALAEAFADVRAAGFFAHGDQLVLAQDVLDFVETGRSAEPALTRIQSGFFRRSTCSIGTILIGMREVLLAPFCFSLGLYATVVSVVIISSFVGRQDADQFVGQLLLHIGQHCLRANGAHVDCFQSGIAARINPGKRGQIHRHIQRQPMIGAAVAAYLQAERGNLRAFVSAAGHIDARRAFNALTDEIIRRKTLMIACSILCTNCRAYSLPPGLLRRRSISR